MELLFLELLNFILSKLYNFHNSDSSEEGVITGNRLFENYKIATKHFSFHVLVFLLLSLPLACPVKKASQHENWNCFAPILKSYQSPPGWKIPKIPLDNGADIDH